MKKNYYYNASTSNVQYGLTQTEHLDIQRLLNDLPAWKMFHEAQIQKPKILIVPIELCVSWSIRKCIILTERLYDLKNKKFQIYQYRNNSFKSIESSDFYASVLDQREKSSIFSMPDIHVLNAEASKQLNIPFDQIYIFSEQELDALIVGDEHDYSSYLDKAELNLHASNLSMDSLNILLEKQKNFVHYLNLSACLNLEGSLHVTKLPNLTTLVLGATSESRNIIGSSFYGKISTILNNESIATLVSSSQQLAHLDLSYLQNIDSQILDKIEKPENLTKLLLKQTPVCPKSLANLLTKAPNLQLLDLYHYGFFSIAEELNLVALEKLDLSSRNLCELSAISLQNLLAHATELKELSLINRKISGEIIKELPLDKLETLNLNGTSIELNSLKNILNRAGNIKHFTFAPQEPFNTLVNLPISVFWETLYLAHLNVNANALEKGLEYAKNLKTIDLCDVSMYEKIIKKLPLHSLIEIRFFATSINTESLGNILAEAVQLKAIDLEQMELSGGAITNSLSLHALKTFSLRHTTIDAVSLSNMFAETIQLRSFNLLKVTLSGSITRCLHFNMLERFSLCDITIDAVSLGNMLAKVTQLKKFVLSDACVSGKIVGSIPFNTVEEIELVHVTIDAASLECFLSQAKNLKKLTIRYCKLTGHLKKPLFFNSLELIDVCDNLCEDELLINILINTTSLQRISFYHKSELSGQINQIISNNAVSLKELYLSTSDHRKALIPIDLIYLENVQQLKRLQLSHYIISKAVCLGSLDSLTLLNISINTITLKNILESAPQLNFIVFDNCIFFGQKIDSINLANLEQIRIVSMTIDAQFLGKLIKRASLQLLLHLRDVKITGKIENRRLLNILYKIDPTGKMITDASVKAEFLKQKINSQQTKNRAHAVSEEPVPLYQSIYDANTAFDSRAMHPVRLFLGTFLNPPLMFYRMNVFNKINFLENCSQDKAFKLELQGDLQLSSPQKIPQKSNEDTWIRYKKRTKLFNRVRYYYSRQHILLTNEWAPLVSLSINDCITHYHVSSPVDIEIQYSNLTNLYYIRQKANKEQDKQTIYIDFIFTASPTLNTLSSLKQYQDIKAKIKECRHFNCAPLKLENVKGPLNGEYYLAALEKQKVGACRHRTLVFKAWMERNHPEIPVHIVNNQVHSFIEMKLNNRWHQYHLGGYRAKLVPNNVIVTNHPDVEKIKKVSFFSKANTKENVIHSKADTKKNIVHSQANNYFSSPVPEAKNYDVKTYLQTIVSGKHKKQLIFLASDAHRDILRSWLQTHCRTIHRPYYYAHSPDDLAYSKRSIMRDDLSNNGYVLEKQNGPLLEFLEQNGNQKSVIVINFDHFQPSDVIRFNSLLDTPRTLGGIKLPDDVIIIALQNPGNPNAYDGADFLSRFDHSEFCPLSDTMFQQSIGVQLPSAQYQNEIATHRILFFGGYRWQEQLQGFWELNGSRLCFVESEMQQIISQIAPGQKVIIEWNNAPWDNKDFLRVWEEITVHKFIKTRYADIKIPDTITLLRSDNYPWEIFVKGLTLNVEERLPSNMEVLNPSTLQRFLSQYEVNEKGNLNKQHGLLAEYQNQELNLYLSAALGQHEWALFLTVCQQYNVYPKVFVAPHVALPKELEYLLPKFQALKSYVSQPMSFIPGEHPLGDCAISSTDSDVSLSYFNANCCVWNISELDPVQLIGGISIKPLAECITEENVLGFQFINQPGALQKALDANKTVVLIGSCSSRMQDLLNSLIILRRNQNDSKGQLVFINKTVNEWSLLPLWEHNVHPKEKKAYLEGHYPDLSFNEHDVQEKTMAHLRAIAVYRQAYPEHQDHTLSEAPWLGMNVLPTSLGIYQDNTRLDDAEEIAKQVDITRIRLLERILYYAPFVFISGKSGVGKTTFMQTIWVRNYPNLHMGDTSLLSWASDKRPGLKVLFLDEANLFQNQWSIFEGLFHSSPSIIVGNDYWELTEEHKVVFAGNPLSYGGERELPALFERHGNGLIFDPLPSAYIYYYLLHPVLHYLSNNKNHIQLLARPILNVAAFLTHCDPKNVLISPRELVMMALLTMSYCKRYARVSKEYVARYYAYELGRLLVPEDLQQNFKQQFACSKLTLSRAHEKKPRDFCLNDSNRPALNALNDLLELRTLRQSCPELQLTGGLGGVVIEGEPGIGKSELVKKVLLAHGVYETKLSSSIRSPNSFYHIPVNLPLDDKTELLQTAFHDGAVVLIDEINSAPMMEHLLNALLMGKTPAGALPKNPGFMVIGTQNPASMAGRNMMSSALLRRLQTIVLPSYQRHELIEIICSKYKMRAKKRFIAQQIVDAYFAKKDSDPECKLCCRDVFKLAKQENKANLPESIQFFKEQLNTFDKKIDSLRDEGQDKEAQYLKEALNELKENYKKYRDHRINLKTFKHNCEQTIANKHTFFQSEEMKQLKKSISNIHKNMPLY